MNKLMHFSNKELFLQILLNISKTKFYKYAVRVLIAIAIVSFVYGFITIMEHITDFVNYVVWGIN